MEIQTPRLLELPTFRGSVVSWISSLTRELVNVFRKVRNDLDNGVTTFQRVDIAGIANADVMDFEPGQVRLYKDTDDGDKIYLVARYGATLYKTELT